MDETEDIARIIAMVCNLAKLTEVGADQDIYDAGMSSLHALGLLVELEDAFAVAIPDTEFMKARTPRAIYQVIGAAKGAA